MQTRKAGLLKLPQGIGFVTIGVYVTASVLLSHVFPPNYDNCEKNTRDLNGGTKIYGEKKFNVILCGNGGDENFMHDKIRMHIFSEQDELLAERTFYVDWESNRLRKLVNGRDYLLYFDASQNNGYRHKISMPPTWLDWMRARLPLAN